MAAGDSGSAGCNLGSDANSDGVLSVNLLAANPYVTAVGGTEFNENGNDALYWSSTNTNTNSANYVSALSYIPEIAWNESCTAVAGANPCGSGYTPGLWAGGGGASRFYSKPSWQTGVPGIPNDGARDVPDVSLTAAGHDPYLICLDNSCQANGLGKISFYGYAGTSAATPSFAGFVALLEGASGSRLGNINPVLYSLAAQESLGNCNASSAQALPASNCVFNDVTAGNNSVPGQSGYNTSSGTYQAGIGYDLATGLGSVNEGNLAVGLAFTGGTPVLSLSTNTLAFGDVPIGSSESLSATVTNTGTAILNLSEFAIAGGGLEFTLNGCAATVFPGSSCTLTFTFKPKVAGPASGFSNWVANTSPNFFYEMTVTGTGVDTTMPALSANSVSFGNQKVGTRSGTQTITVTNSTAQSLSLSEMSLSATSQFEWSTNCGNSLAVAASCSVFVVFTPAFAGSASATLTVPEAGSVPITGTGTLDGYFILFNAGTGKVLDVPAGSGKSTEVRQDAFNGDAQQRWSFQPTGSGSYVIQNVSSGEVLDDEGFSLSNGTHIQLYDYLGFPNQQWVLTQVDDVHYAITNADSGKVLDIPGNSTEDGVIVEQYQPTYSPEQLWVLLPATTSSIQNGTSSLVLGIAGSSPEPSAQVEQATPSGMRDQQWEIVPAGGGYYEILNRLSGLVLDDSGYSLSNGTFMQQYEYLGFANQQWQIVPVDGMNYKILNRLSGLALDDSGYSMKSGTPIQQWQYLGGWNQVWQFTPMTYYNIKNELSGLALDVPGGGKTPGQTIDQAIGNGSEQQEWAVVNQGPNAIIINNLTSAVLDVVGGSTADGAQIDQTAFVGVASQFWTMVPGTNGFYEIRNVNSGLALDDSGYSLSSGTFMQQYGYLGYSNQQWQFVPVVP